MAETTEANNFESTDTKEISDIKIEEAPKQEINIGIVYAIIGAVLLLLLLILIFAVRKKKDNPGFAPVSLTKTNYEANGVYYARITGHFNDWYGSYYHEGVDFEGSVGTPIHSFICGKVVMMKNQGTKHYGLSVLIQKNEKEDGKNVYYLLGHLSEYAPQLTINSQVYPGMVVGKVGNTGNCRTNGHALTPQERNKGLGSHLHLSLYKTKLTFDDLYDKTNENFKTIQCGLVNPFLHVEIRNVDK